MHNLNRLLAWGHARALENLLEKAPECTEALADKFADEHLIVNALKEKGQKIRLTQRTKAESDVAVAAASIMARAQFVRALRDLGEKNSVKTAEGRGNRGGCRCAGNVPERRCGTSVADVQDALPHGLQGAGGSPSPKKQPWDAAAVIQGYRRVKVPAGEKNFPFSESVVIFRSIQYPTNSCGSRRNESGREPTRRRNVWKDVFQSAWDTSRKAESIRETSGSSPKKNNSDTA